MKNILKIFLVITLFFTMSNISQSNAGFFDDASPKIEICDGDNDCGLLEGINQVKDTLKDSVTDRNASDYIQDVVAFLLGFIAIIAVIVIIYAGFNILTAAGDEEKVKKAKMTIMYVIIGVIVIYLAGPIFNLVVQILNVTPPTP